MSRFSCIICMESLVGAIDQYLEEMIPVVLPCGHTFHELCVSRWHEKRATNPGIPFNEKYNCPTCKHHPVCAFNNETAPPTRKYTALYLDATDPHLHEIATDPPNPRVRRLMALSKRIAQLSAVVDVADESIGFTPDGNLITTLNEKAYDSYLKAGEKALKDLENLGVQQQLKTDVDALTDSFNQFTRGYALLQQLERAQKAIEEANAERDAADLAYQTLHGYMREERKKYAQGKMVTDRVATEWETKFEGMKSERDRFKVSMKEMKTEIDGMKDRIRNLIEEKEKAEVSAQAANEKLNEQTRSLIMARSQVEIANQRRKTQAEKYLIAANENKQEIETLRKQVASLKEENLNFRKSLPTRSDRQSSIPFLHGHSRTSERRATSNLPTWSSGDAYDSPDDSVHMNTLEESMLEVDMPSLRDSFFSTPDGRDKPHPTRREIRIPDSKGRSSGDMTDIAIKTSSSEPSSSPITFKHDITHPVTSGQARPLRPMTFSIGTNNPLPGHSKTLAARSGIRNNPFSNTATKKIGKEGEYADRHGRIKKGVVSGPPRRFKATR